MARKRGRDPWWQNRAGARGGERLGDADVGRPASCAQRIRGRMDAEYTYFILLTSNDATEDNQLAPRPTRAWTIFLTKPLKFEELWNRLRVAERILRYATQVKQLEEMLPICAYCKKIRDDHNYWQQIEGYINERTGSEFSHSVCPDCYHAR